MRAAVRRLTALLAAADSQRCPALLGGVALTLRGRGRRGQPQAFATRHKRESGSPVSKWAIAAVRPIPPSGDVGTPRIGLRLQVAKPNQRIQLTGRAILPREGFCPRSAARS